MPSRRHAPLATIVLLALAPLSACSARRNAAVDYSGPPAAERSATLESMAVSASGVRGQPALAQSGRQVVRRARVAVEVGELAPTQARLERAAAALGAQVARAETRQDEQADYVLRVPADRLDAMTDSVAALGRVESRTVSAQDVTEHVVDTEARLGALRASRDRLRQLLERASTVQDVVAVERELARVQGEVESLEARLSALRGQVALSELTVTLRRRPVLGPLGLLLAGAARLVGKLFVWR